jgi:hypothetical protein
MQTLTLNSMSKADQLPASQNSTRRRALRFLSERYAQRERPSVAAELGVLALIILTSAWSILNLAQALAFHH